MEKLFKRLFIDYAIPLIFGCFVVVLLLIVYIVFAVGAAYQQKATVEQPEIKQLEKQLARVKKITLKKQSEDGETCLTLSRNGAFIETDCATRDVLRKGILDKEEVNNLFGQLEKGVFEGLADSYSSDTTYTLIIETTAGTKTITLGGSGNDSSGVLSGLIDQLEELAEELPFSTPPPAGGPTASPVSTPQPTVTPTPLTTPPAGGPSPTPLSPGATPEPFSCGMLSPHGKSIVVSGIVCLP